MTTQTDLFDPTYRSRMLARKDDICANRHKGNPQSMEANKKTDKHVQRRVILETLKLCNSTCEELEDATGFSHQSCSARISELKRDGLIHKIGIGTTRSGCNAAVYTVASNLSQSDSNTVNPNP